MPLIYQTVQNWHSQNWKTHRNAFLARLRPPAGAIAQMKPFRFPSEGTQQLFEAVLADGNFVDIPNFPSFSRSVSAADRVASNGLVSVPDQSRPLWGGWKLVCLDHKVHCDAEFCQGLEQNPPRKKCECYTVSNLRPFTVQVELQVGASSSG